MQSNTLLICQCCLQRPSKSHLKDFDSQIEKNKSYLEMLKESIGIELKPSAEADGICTICIKRLLDAYEFRLQVLTCQNSLEQSTVISNEKDKSDIKIEAECETEVLEVEYLSDYTENDYADMNDGDLLMPIDDIKEEVHREICVTSEIPKDTESDAKKKTINVGTSKSKTYVKRAKSKKRRNALVKKSSSRRAGKNVKFKVEADSSMDEDRPVAEEAKEILFMIESNLNSKKHSGRPVLNAKDKIIKDRTETNMKNLIKSTNCTPFFSKNLSGFLCYYCRQGFNDLAELRTHTNTEHDVETLKISADPTALCLKLDITDLKCTICHTPSKDLVSVTKHLIEKHKVLIHTNIPNYIQEFKLPNDGVFQCTCCHSKFETFKMLLQHMNGHYRNFVCDICDSGFLNKSRLKSHKFMHSTQSFKCQKCDKVFPTVTKRSYHMKCHTGARRKWVCPHCHEELNADHLVRNRHLLQKHNIATAKYRCGICDKDFLLKSRLTIHTKKHHLLEKSHACPQCDYTCFAKDSLKFHMLRHNGEKVHKCEVCHKAFVRKKTLREHMRIHNNDRRHKCNVCASAFVQKCSLKSHMQTHHSMTVEENELLK